MTNDKNVKTRRRFGIGEWYGKLFTSLSASEKKYFATSQGDKNFKPDCPFRMPGQTKGCGKAGGVCSLRLYEEIPGTNLARPVSGHDGELRITCPCRFEQNGMIYQWISKILLNNETPLILGEIGFLESEKSELTGAVGGDDVGRIDNVLVHPDADPLKWCAVEVQAVYFSGYSMTPEFKAIGNFQGEGILFPTANRRPDYRSSGPKRLMPQLQIKVPTLRRWGKKMAVAVDCSFYRALGKMDDVKDVSNCDIAWFIVTFEEKQGKAVLAKDFVQFTTLERAVEGLTGGLPVSQETFERRIKEKLSKKVKPQ